MRLLITLMLSFPLFADMDSACSSGKALGHSQAKNAFSQAQHTTSNDLTPSITPMTPEKATQKLKNAPTSEITAYLTRDDVQQNYTLPDENASYLTRSEHIATQSPNTPESLTHQEYLEGTCTLSDAPYPLSLIRERHVEVAHHPALVDERHICNTHSIDKKYSSKSDANSRLKKVNAELKTDPHISYIDVEVKHKGFRDWRVQGTWGHNDNAPTCNSYHIVDEVVREESWEEIGDSWLYASPKDQKSLSSPYCTYYQTECLDKTPTKIINGKEVTRQCWKEKLSFICRYPTTQDCPYQKDQNCELLTKTCLHESTQGCALWELVFRCLVNTSHKQEGDLFGMDEEHTYEPNDSFSEIAAKFALFEALKEELEDSEAHDARYVQVFKGTPMKCSKSVADELMYDCCFAHPGLVQKLKLKQCSEEEITLSEMRDQDLCYYVGAYDEKFLDLWTSRDEHVFCCFKSKLARLVQEQGRAQLGMQWGKPKYTDCRGLTLDEISSLDLASMDFSELYKDHRATLPENFQARLTSFQKKIEQKVEDDS